MSTTWVRAVLTTPFGCKARTDWYLEGAPEVVKAMLKLMSLHPEPYKMSWERREQDNQAE